MRNRTRVVFAIVATLTASAVPAGAATRPTGHDPIGGSEVLVRFDEVVPAGTVDRLEQLGAVVLGYEPGAGIVVRVDHAVVAPIGRLTGVTGVESSQPREVIETSVATPIAPGLFTVMFDPDGGPEVLADVPGLEIVEVSDRLALVSAEEAALVAGVPGVAAVEPFTIRARRNEAAGAVIGAGTAQAAGYDGSGQIVAVADTGLGGGTASTAHRDIPASRIAAVRDWPTAGFPTCWDAFPDGARDVDSGHGTHVAGSAVSGGGAGGVGRGTAPGASLVFQATEDYIEFLPACGDPGDSGYYLTGIPADVTSLFGQAYALGARVHSDSWGVDAAGGYSTDSANADAFVWDNPDMTIVVAAGNAGADSNNNGIVDPGSIGSPATAKNVIAVGASENRRPGGYPCDSTFAPGAPFSDCAAVGGTNDVLTYGDLGYSTGPLAADPTAGNVQQVAAFSSRGPTSDGRVKPDVVAPGTWILSAYSNLYQEGYDGAPNPQNGLYQGLGWGFPYDEHYKYNLGTSMATPLVAGAAAVVRQFVEDVTGSGASAALVKAMLINSAVDLRDENNDGANDNDFPIPNIHEGWGRVDVAEAVDGDRSWVDGPATDTGLTTSYQVESPGGVPLKITLVWSDHPASLGAASALVNDLDLEVIAPNGTSYRGNRFAGGWSTTGGTADRVNNVENVYVSTPAAGIWTIRVRGHNVPFGPQPYALVSDGAHGIQLAPTLSIQSPTPDARVSGSVTISATASDASIVTFEVDGETVGVDTSPSGGWSAEWDTIGYSESSHLIEVVASAPGGAQVTQSRSVVVDNLSAGGTFVDDDGNVHEPMIEAIAAAGVTRGCSGPGDSEARYCPGDQVTRGQMAAFLVRAFEYPSISGDRFSDDDTSVFERDIEALAAVGVTLGCNPPANDLFCPDDPVTRAQMAAFLVRALGLSPPPGDRFVDDDGSVFEEDIEALAAEGVTLGCNPPANDRFCPEEPVLRDQMASFLGRALGLTPLIP